MRGPRDIGRIAKVGPVTRTRDGGRREQDEREAARQFQAALRREYIDHHLGERAGEGRAHGRDVAVGFEERVIVSGERAAETLVALERLARFSPTFRGVLETSFSRSDTLWVVIGRGGGFSRATIGAGDEKVYINLDQGDLVDLLIHECGHALAKLVDGPLGGFGANQRFQAMVKREMDMAQGGVKAYGTEVRPETRSRGGR